MKKRCNNCGCERKILMDCKVHIEETTLSLKRLCVPCLLKFIGLQSEFSHSGEYDYKKAMEVHL